MRFLRKRARRRARGLIFQHFIGIETLWGSAEKIIKIRLTGAEQGGRTCGAIDEPRKSSKAIDRGVIIKKCHNCALSRQKWGFYPIYIYICTYYYICFIYFHCSIHSFYVLLIAFLFYR